VFKLLVYPISVLAPFFSIFIWGIVDISNCFVCFYHSYKSSLFGIVVSEVCFVFWIVVETKILKEAAHREDPTHKTARDIEINTYKNLNVKKQKNMKT
jgi:hypothetical protein